MRIIVPDKIQRLGDIIAPYMYFNEENDAVELHPEAPVDVVKAREEYQNWWGQYEND